MAGPSDIYPVIAQIAATFAGFGSLASGIGERRSGDDVRIDVYRVRFMLFASLSATVLGLLPATLAGLWFAPGWELRGSAAVGVIALGIYVPLSFRQVRTMTQVAGFNMLAGIANTACALTALAAFGWCVAGIAAERTAGLYLVALMALLGSSIIMFSRIIVSMLRPHSEGRRQRRD